MNSTTKTFALLGFTLALSKDLAEAKNERVSWRAKHLLRAAYETANLYPSTDLKKSQVKQIALSIQKINEFGVTNSDEIERQHLVPVLAMILCGIDDVLKHTRNPLTRDLFAELEKKVMWLNDLIDPKLDQVAEYIRGEHYYEEWTA